MNQWEAVLLFCCIITLPSASWAFVGTLPLSSSLSSSFRNALLTQQSAVLRATRRDVLAGTLAVASSSLLLPNNTPSSREKANAMIWETDPVNKRTGIRVNDAESSGYNIAFVTYLTRFLLSFDQETQQFWFRSSGRDRVEIFSELAASVELKLLDYTGGKDGSTRLLNDLLVRYCPTPTDATPKRQRREIKEARRQIILLFALLEKTQPVTELTRLLATVDNGKIISVNTTVVPFAEAPVMSLDSTIIIAPPPIGTDRAHGKPVLQSCLKDISIIDGGSGYTQIPNIVVKGGGPSSATATIKDGSITRIIILQSKNQNDVVLYSDIPEIVIDPPPIGGKTAIAEAVLEERVVGVEVDQSGSGYAVEKPVKVFFGPTKFKNATSEELKTLSESNQIKLIGTAIPVSERSSYSSFRKEGDDNLVSAADSGTDDGLPPLPFWSPKSPSSNLLRLLPSGVGVEYDSKLKRYGLAIDQAYQMAYPSISRRPLGPEFGPRGRAPIERNRELTADTLLRFSASGAVCASGVHLALCWLDVVKIKVQIDPERYPNVPSAFNTVLKEEGPQTFFTGWAPTVLGNFVSGAVLYTLTEVIRRYLTEAAGADAIAYEVPIILFAAAVASAVGSVLICPFDAVKIRSIAQPNYGPNALAVLKRLIEEEGAFSLINAIPVFLVKNVPYAMVKFTVFDLSTERLFEAFPAATEELKLSLLVSLVGGILGGTAAAIVSNPADALISELKKTKSDASPLETAAQMWEREAWGAFFKGLPLRMVYYSLIASLQFLVYDGVRFALGIGPDDLRLYLDVLGGALQGSGGPT